MKAYLYAVQDLNTGEASFTIHDHDAMAGYYGESYAYVLLKEIDIDTSDIDAKAITDEAIAERKAKRIADLEAELEKVRAA